MNVFHNHVGINLTNSKIQLVEISFAGDEFIVENIDEEYLSEFLDFNEKETKLISVIQNAYNEILIRKPVECKYASFTLPRRLFSITELPLENTLKDSDLLEHLQWEYSLLYPYNDVKDYKFQFYRIDGINPNNVIVGALNKKFIKILTDFCVRNNFEFKYVDTPHFAADNILKTEPDFTAGKNILSLFISEGDITLNIYGDSKLIGYHKVFPKHAGDIIPKLIEILQSSRTIAVNTNSISRIFVSGDDVSETLIENIKKNLEIEVAQLNPFDKINFSKDLLESRMQISKQHSFISAAGIAFRIV